MSRIELLEQHPQYKEALSVMQTLHKAGFEALLAGGCVRDALLEGQAKDLDIATSAHPDDVEKLFEKTIAIGRQFGTMIVVGKHGQYETTTFRKDGPYLDGRHPTSVVFTDMEEDAKRRDFTINALFYDTRKHDVIDFVSGRKDLAAKIIRTVGDPNERFEEDHLRLLRAVRFAAQLGFDIEAGTWKSICQLGGKIADVSVERILQELLKLLSSSRSTLGLEKLVESGLAKHVLPSLIPLHAAPDKWNPFIVRAGGSRDPAVTLAFAGESVLGGLTKLKASSKLTQTVRKLIQSQKLLWGPSAKADRVKLWAQPEWASILAMAEIEAEHRENGFHTLDLYISEYLSVCDQKGNLPKPFISGEDLLKMGFSAGPAFGKVLEEMYRLQLEGKISSKQQAQVLVKTRLENTSSEV